MTTGSAAPTDDLVVLADDAGRPVGTAPRASVHSSSTPLHLAFSCYVLDDGGRVLVTRRALSKRTWPGVWTNSFCGHPRPGEDPAAAVRRYARHELGLTIAEPRAVLPDFRYRATDAAGVVENEICPVFATRTADVPAPHPDEVMDLRWVDPQDLVLAVRSAPWAFSPWMALQLEQLDLPALVAAPAA